MIGVDIQMKHSFIEVIFYIKHKKIHSIFSEIKETNIKIKILFYNIT
jgi:hypothetical protein